MSSPTPLATFVPNEGTTRDPLESDQPTLENRGFSMVYIIPPLLLITSATVALTGLGPYLNLRSHILRQIGVMQSIRMSVEDGNKRFLEHASRIRDVEATAYAYQLKHQKAQGELQMKLQLLEQKCQQVEALSRSQAEALRMVQGALEKSRAREQEMERLMDDVGNRLGSTLGQVAAFMEESQLKDGELPDKFGVSTMRQLALDLQHKHKAHFTSHPPGGNLKVPESP